MDGEILKFLQASGPYSAPLCVAMAVAIKYLLGALAKMETRATTAEADATKLRDRRADDLVAATKAMGEFGEQMRNSLNKHSEEIERVLDLVKQGERK